MSAHEQMRAMLDQLMGTGRDGENNKFKVHFTDPRVCKSFLLACCPHDILAATSSGEEIVSQWILSHFGDDEADLSKLASICLKLVLGFHYIMQKNKKINGLEEDSSSEDCMLTSILVSAFFKQSSGCVK